LGIAELGDFVFCKGTCLNRQAGVDYGMGGKLAYHLRKVEILTNPGNHEDQRSKKDRNRKGHEEIHAKGAKNPPIIQFAMGKS
jgi:hypothetical protein